MPVNLDFITTVKNVLNWDICIVDFWAVGNVAVDKTQNKWNWFVDLVFTNYFFSVDGSVWECSIGVQNCGILWTLVIATFGSKDICLTLLYDCDIFVNVVDFVSLANQVDKWLISLLNQALSQCRSLSVL